MSVYDQYYEVTKMTKLQLDPRAKRRAAGRGFANFTIATLITLWVTQIAVAWQLQFDKALGPIVFPPGRVFSWYAQFYFRSYPSAAFARHVREIFQHAGIALACGVILSIALGIGEYFRSRNDRTNLSTEKGGARWATPQEIAGIGPGLDPTDSLFPPGYDIYNGFSAASRTQQRAVRQSAKTHFTAQRASREEIEEEPTTPA